MQCSSCTILQLTKEMKIQELQSMTDCFTTYWMKEEIVLAFLLRLAGFIISQL